eukprot:scaffold11674_cov60-Phaeocystis_antarctica.AAC.1
MPLSAANCSALFTPRSTPRKGTLRFGAVLTSTDTDGKHVVVAVTVTIAWWLSCRTTPPVARVVTAEGPVRVAVYGAVGQDHLERAEELRASLAVKHAAAAEH